MKQGIHPDNYRVVVFKDMSDGTQFFSQVVWTSLCLATAIALASNAGNNKGGRVCPPLLLFLILDF